MKKKVFARAIALMNALLLLLIAGVASAENGTSGAFSGAPAAIAATRLTAGEDAQILLLFSEPVVAAAGGTVALTDGQTRYTAALAAPAEGTAAARQVALPARAFLDENKAALTLADNVSYTVTVSAGAFVDAGGGACAESGGLTLAANAGETRTVTHELSESMGWKLVVVASDASQTELASGTAVALNTVIKAVAAQGAANPCGFTIYSGGQRTDGAGLTAGYTVTADTQILAEPAALSGTASIAGTAAYGQVLSASYAPPSGVTGPSKLNYQWLSGQAPATGDAGSSSYTIQPSDVGKTITLAITSPWCTGRVTATTAEVARGTAAAAPAAPTVAQETGDSVTLNAVNGCEYRVDINGSEGAWQASPAFLNLTRGQTYTFYQRYAQTATQLASPASPGCTIGTTAALTGTLVITGDMRVQSTVQAQLSASNNTGELRYRWRRDATEVGNQPTYTIKQEDLGKTLVVEVSSTVQQGVLSAVGAPVGKAVPGAPGAPTMAGKTANSITLHAVSGCEYSIDGINWQDATTFDNLTTGQTYTFYQRFKETNTAQASWNSAAASITTVSALAGTISVSGDVRYGKTLVASFTGSGGSGTLTYLWYRGASQVGSGQAYDVTSADIGNPIYVRVVSSADNSSVTQLVGTAKKAEYMGAAPEPPARASRSTSKISLKSSPDYEYSGDGSNWQDSAVFTGLKAGTSYRFYQRVKATDTVEASPASQALRTSTSSSGESSSSSSSSGSDSGSSGSSGASDGEEAADTPASTTTLNSYTLTPSNTRILFSQMEGLINGNKTQDVTIRGDDVEYTFAKATMQLTAGTLWYDFGVKIDTCTHQQSVQQLAGAHLVRAVHFNHEGNLPAKATIRISLGAEHAAKTLYYYKYVPASNALTFMQTATVDAKGWATVEQSSCSDYAFLDADITAAALETPAPTASESPLPTASPTADATAASTQQGAKFGGAWLIAVIAIVALLMIIVGVCMYLKSKSEANAFDDDFFDEEDYDEAYDAERTPHFLGGDEPCDNGDFDGDDEDDGDFDNGGPGSDDDEPAPYRGPRRPRPR